MKWCHDPSAACRKRRGTPVGMTTEEGLRQKLFVAEGFDGVELGGFCGGPDAED